MHKEEINQWFKALLYSLIVFAFFSAYLYLRREIFNLYVLNKVFALTAAVVAGATLLIGPLSKIYPHFNQFMGIRRELGILAFVFAAVHILISLILQNKFPFPSWYLNEIVPILFGLTAILIWAYMTYISRSSKIKQLGAENWSKILSLSGKIAFLAIFLHLVTMKYPGWINWFKGLTKQTPELANPHYPPASLYVFFIMLAVIVFRIVNDLIHRNANKEKVINNPPQNPQILPPSPDET